MYTRAPGQITELEDGKVRAHTLAAACIMVGDGRLVCWFFSFLGAEL